jgi:outer membrane protein
MSAPVLLMAALVTLAPAAPEPETLRLTLADAVRLALDSDAVRIHRLGHDTARYQLTAARGRAFDPTLISSFASSDATAPTVQQIEGVDILTNRRTFASTRLEHRLPTGTRTDVTFTGDRQATNSQNSSFNPLFSSSLQVAVTQPLLRNRTGLLQRGPVIAARQASDESRAALEANVAAAVEHTVRRYWDAVLAAERLVVQRKALELVETTHAKNRRMLELGAIAPLEIHRSESDVATRKLDVLAAEFERRRREDELRRGLGLDADPSTAEAPLELLDRPEPEEAPAPVAAEAIAQALRARPDLLSLRYQLDADDTEVRLAKEDARPTLDLRAAYTARGVAGTQFEPGQTPSVIRSRTDLADAFDQSFDRRFPTWDVSLTFAWPVRNRAARAAVATAQTAQDRRRLQVLEMERQIALEVRSAIDQVAHARQAIALASIAREHAGKTLQAEQRKYELGTTELFLVLDAQTRVAQSELSLLSAKVGFQTATTRLDLVTGRLLERHGIAAE